MIIVYMCITEVGYQASGKTTEIWHGKSGSSKFTLHMSNCGHPHTIRKSKCFLGSPNDVIFNNFVISLFLRLSAASPFERDDSLPQL